MQTRLLQGALAVMLFAAAGPAWPDSAEREQAFRASRRAVDELRRSALAQRDSDPQRYVVQMEAALQRARRLIADSPGVPEAEGLASELAGEALRAATYARFALGESRRAVALYEQAIALAEGRAPPGNDAFLQRAGLADTLRFDLADRARSLRAYEDLLALTTAGRAVNEIDAMLRRVTLAWLRAELAYLREGRRYAGTPDRESLVPVAMIAMGGGTGRADDPVLAAMGRALEARAPTADERRAFARQLEALSPSQARILAAADFLPLLETPERVAAFLRRHDPTGYLTVHLFAGWHFVEEQGAGRSAPRNAGMSIGEWGDADRALMREAEVATLGRRLAVAAGDPRLASPESTWKTFVAALARADREAALKCATPELRFGLEQMFEQMTPGDFKAAVRSLGQLRKAVETGNVAEASGVRGDGEAYVVTFYRAGTEWRISGL
jgi:hypothetical protein